MTDVITAI